MSTPYEQLNQETAEAFRKYAADKQTAGRILNSVADRCSKDLGIPSENILWHPTEASGDKSKAMPAAQYYVDRNEQGRWYTAMTVSVNPPGTGEYLVTHLYFEIKVQPEGRSATLWLLKDGGGDFEIEADVADFDHANLAPLLNEILQRLKGTTKWLVTGEGEKPTIGFGSNKR